jgi:hypothetical protein
MVNTNQTAAGKLDEKRMILGGNRDGLMKKVQAEPHPEKSLCRQIGQGGLDDQ